MKGLIDGVHPDQIFRPIYLGTPVSSTTAPHNSGREQESKIQIYFTICGWILILVCLINDKFQFFIHDQSFSEGLGEVCESVNSSQMF